MPKKENTTKKIEKKGKITDGGLLSWGLGA
jgi:hypothetical protein